MRESADPSGGQPTRTAVLNYLKEKGEAEAKTLAAFCGLTTMAVRRHLLQLQAGGLVAARIERRPQGRPVSLYSLTEQGDARFPREYAGLAADLLDALRLVDGEKKVGELFRRRRASMAARYAARVEGKALADRVREVAAIMTESGHMASAEASGAGGFVLTEHNCPVPALAKSFPDICREELCLIRDLTGGQVQRTSHAAAGGRNCSYRIKSSGRARRTRPATRPPQ